MIIDILVPSAGESISQVELARWMVEDGAYIEKDQEIAEIDSDKATLSIHAEASGKIQIVIQEGSSIEPGKVIGKIDTSIQQASGNGTKHKAPPEEKIPEAKPEKAKSSGSSEFQSSASEDFTFSPQAKKLIDQLDLPLEEALRNPESKRITKQEILQALAAGQQKKQQASLQAENPLWDDRRSLERQKMSTLRKKITQRLVGVKNQTAMLTTFQEADMTAVLELRKKHQSSFQEKYGLKLGIMSFFAKAITQSIPFWPLVNAYLEEDHIIIPSYADLGIAVSTPKGLMVPVIRDAHKLSIPRLEQQIFLLANKARDNKISIEELTGGTISITNGGVFGSMLSTPILNPPQSAILGMHNIIERPVAVKGKVEIRPMMYLALSYDHRIIDGVESVGFLKMVKEMIENPARMLLQGRDPESILLELD
jgi:2-oxoglutarate dehydrogenase E2 component (dihydrolipoamide succinyltransferase)